MTPTDAIRVMTYNIRACLGIDRKRSIDRVAEVIAGQSPAIVALQEVDLERERSGRVDQAERLARVLNMNHTTGVSFQSDDGGAYGNSVLSLYPLRRIRHDPLPILDGTEPRSVMCARVDLPSGPLDLVNTHLSFRRRDRPWQIDAIVRDGWLQPAAPGGRLVLCGDLNCTPRDRGFRLLAERLRDVSASERWRERSSWPTRRPIRRIDHILVSRAVPLVSSRVARSSLARAASDHFPVVADLELSSPSKQREEDPPGGADARDTLDR